MSEHEGAYYCLSDDLNRAVVLLCRQQRLMLYRMLKVILRMTSQQWMLVDRRSNLLKMYGRIFWVLRFLTGQSLCHYSQKKNPNMESCQLETNAFSQHLERIQKPLGVSQVEQSCSIAPLDGSQLIAFVGDGLFLITSCRNCYGTVRKPDHCTSV